MSFLSDQCPRVQQVTFFDVFARGGLSPILSAQHQGHVFWESPAPPGLENQQDGRRLPQGGFLACWWRRGPAISPFPSPP